MASLGSQPTFLIAKKEKKKKSIDSLRISCLNGTRGKTKVVSAFQKHISVESQDRSS